MWLQAGALQPVPSYAVVGHDDVAAVLVRLTSESGLEDRLDVAFKLLEQEQPSLASLLSGELSSLDQQAGQALLYFLFLVVFLSFRAAFGRRLATISQQDIGVALERLVLDGQVRSQACAANSYSEDVIALSQPALMRLVHDEVRHAPEDAGDVDPILQTSLVQILALTHAVAPAD
jgi:hypothetical protein